ncbi:glucose 1-dehydrogenase [Rothia uropygialis]|uniref:glucose 1-dehydrogenase n=1 Tax=Kocuria sp. 36 TaxID=1415402 RepID=UPI00101D7261|nr:glucose 1-dehydrogenase [Kocuria sp. 36]
MYALTVKPGESDSTSVEEIPEPRPADNELLVRGLAIGICGTDKEIVDGKYGWSPDERQHLVLGHESLGRVEQAPSGSGFSVGDLVAGVVRRPDPVPCGACARGQWDMCRNGRYTERGIKQLDGYGSQHWTIDPEFAVRLDPRLGLAGVLLEPTTIVAKAWEQVERIGHRSWFAPQTVLVTGAGPVGLLAAMIGVQQGLDVHVLDQLTDGPKPDLVEALGATYHTSSVTEISKHHRPDVVIEATGAGQVIFDAIAETGPYGIVCLTGVSGTGKPLKIDAGRINREIVLDNDAIVGSVNANLRHYKQAAHVLAKADLGWLERLITRRIPLKKAPDAFASGDHEVKTVVLLDEEGL